MNKLACAILLTVTALATARCAHDSSALPLPAGLQTTPGMQHAASHSSASSALRVVYRFSKETNGQGPSGTLVALHGVLYGTTSGGGPEGNQAYYGTVFSFNPATGKQHVLYDFKGGSDGITPIGGLVASGGMLYGTTSTGGGTACSVGCGTVFSLDPSTGSERVLHVFNQAEGAYPESSLTVVNGKLYGTAASGGTNRPNCSSECGSGTVFSVDPSSGKLTVVHSFTDSPDGASPRAPLTYVNGTLYGTTEEGGSLTYCDDTRPCGTVFAIDVASGQERIVYSFEGGIDGESPVGGLTFANGKLYGTTASGGTGSCEEYSNACGTVFSIVPATGEERVVYRFTENPDGSDPESALIATKGTLYGTTRSGGTPYDGGLGTIFAIDMATRQERVVHAFPMKTLPSKATHGEYPSSPLIALNGILYGTTESGGAYRCGFEGQDGCGTIFAVTP
jgi:uncharacterized repeat protein (TIGR03803 family)